ncbi:hypothetical protein RCO48_33575 [Peribacillus frigoritolerans]|nr:hypothetical protein [Peribacillus frigoritolerans]
MRWSYTEQCHFFNREVEMKLTFEPIAQKNGDLILKQKSIAVG